MIIQASNLNDIENSFSPHALGIEALNESSFTYNDVLAAINNHYLPIIKSIVDGGFSYGVVGTFGYDTNVNKYFVDTTNCTYTSNSPSIVMVSTSGGGFN